MADPYNERFRLAIGFQSDKVRLDYSVATEVYSGAIPNISFFLIWFADVRQLVSFVNNDIFLIMCGKMLFCCESCH